MANSMLSAGCWMPAKNVTNAESRERRAERYTREARKRSEEREELEVRKILTFHFSRFTFYDFRFSLELVFDEVGVLESEEPFPLLAHGAREKAHAAPHAEAFVDLYLVGGIIEVHGRAIE
jgi:hypothetical protein